MQSEGLGNWIENIKGYIDGKLLIDDGQVFVQKENGVKFRLDGNYDGLHCRLKIGKGEKSLGSRVVGNKNDKLVSEIKEYIEANYHEPNMTLEHIAKTFYISRCHFSRVFKSTLGIGFKDYLISVRIHKAKQMLEQGDYVTDVCYAVGYGCLTHFGRIFKHWTGCLPSEYRKQFLKSETAS